MNGTMKYIMYIGVTILLTLCFCGCSDDAIVDTPKGDGALLNMYVSMKPTTRLAELGSIDDMFKDEYSKGKKDVGLYIYYEDDYNGNPNDANGDLSKPYIRNLRCTYTNGKLTPVTGEPIYIYDRMTIVAFYPYNDNAPDFEKPIDEKAYPITESDYSKQHYIPYRATTTVNPTNAYMIELDFKPQQTCKIEVVLVSDDPAKFPQSKNNTNGDIKLVPEIDRYEGPYDSSDPAKGDLRENWLDAIEDFPKDNNAPVGGKYARRYTAYVWKSSETNPHHDGYTHHNNIIEKGDVIFESDKLILRASNRVDLSEETVYRYGYNLETGEVFIPTSDRLVYDAPSLQAVNFDEYRAYQVCDVDLSKLATTWTPKTAFKGTYDGGGHKIENLSITATTTEESPSVGLFSNIASTSTLMNIDLVNPTITVTCSNDTKVVSYIGALCGIVNPELTEEQKRKMIEDSLPKELSGPVKEALVQERLKDFGNTTCYVRGCKVTDPVITVKGENARVGGLCGGAGGTEQKVQIKDSYVWQSKTDELYTGIAVNAATEEDKEKYTTAYVAGFCGTLAHGEIKNCYSTMEEVHAYIKGTGTDDGDPASEDVAQGFYNPAPAKEAGSTLSVVGCYTRKEDTNVNVENFATGWPTSWPLFKDDGDRTNHGDTGYNSEAYPVYKWTDSWYDMGVQGSTYPTLVWEHPLTIEL